MRYLKYDNSTIASFAGALPKELLGADGTETNEVKGSFLPENISDISISPDLSKMFYLFNTQENAIGTTSGTLGDKKIQVFDSPFQEWLAWWPNPSMITLTTKPSSGVPGYMYAVDPSKKDFNQILGNISGLTTLASPDGKLVLYADSNLSLGVYNIKSRSSNSLPVRTLPEKCTWGLKSDIVYCAVPKYLDTVSYPDAWYMGKVSFSDEIWQLNITTGNSTILVDPLSVIGGEDIDGIKMALDKDESYLFFVNKKDSFLWELELK
jgi:hypothetical protein